MTEGCLCRYDQFNVVTQVVVVKPSKKSELKKCLMVTYIQ